MTDATRRQILRTVPVIATGGLAGCATDSYDDDDSSDRDTSEQPEYERACTDAYVTGSDWDAHPLSSDEVTASLVNQGDIAGTVTVTIKLWEGDHREELVGTVVEDFSVSAQTTTKITMYPPNKGKRYSISVTDQHCITRRVDK